ncbi:uncharacterized protein BDZ99DRAFT_212406 [Mytilinidion resinicola]|uniref:Uncharacterized protein n=1 Tax=Mytilinidion resinicola TaxID=574789 RepID=A0A6A6XZP3_9PEZI|nr:uncharacterized protein BDZ99DRAFT_212406 [Mytilinidion resinicola]KAF2801992.1 hypothetical protein BDZ99DRAFT_212406 [Mytilinidion resinicola]
MAGSISPQPSFHLCPDFSIAPPPDGHLQLGSVLHTLDIDGVLTPLDIGATVLVPESQRWPRDNPMEKMGFNRSLKELRGLEGSIWAKIFGWNGLGAMFSFLRRRENDETLAVEKLFVQYFIPTTEYMKQALEVNGVAFYIRENKFKEPVYLVTGLMWTEGAKLSKIKSKKNKVSGQAAVTGTTGGTSGAYESEESLYSSFDGSTPFILGIRVRKIWWDKEGTRHNEHDVVGATLGDPKGKNMDVLDGLQSADDTTGQTIADETQLGEANPITWVWP